MPQASCVNKTVLTFGIVEVILAIGLIGCGIFDIYFQSFLYYIGHGIWGGAFILLAAIFAISAGAKQISSCLHVTHMVLAILTCVLILPGVIILFVIEGGHNYDRLNNFPYYGAYNYGNNDRYVGSFGTNSMRDSSSNASSRKSSLVQSFRDSAAQIKVFQPKVRDYVYYANNPELNSGTPSAYGSGSITLDPAILENNDTIVVFFENFTQCDLTAARCNNMASTNFNAEVKETDTYQDTSSEMSVTDEMQTTVFPRDTKTESTKQTLRIMATTTSIQPPTTTSPTNQMKTTFTALYPYNTNYPAPNAFDSTSPTSKVNDRDYYYGNNNNPDPPASYSPPNELNNNYASLENYNPDPAVTYTPPNQYNSYYETTGNYNPYPSAQSNEYNNNYGGSYNGYNLKSENTKRTLIIKTTSIPTPTTTTTPTDQMKTTIVAPYLHYTNSPDLNMYVSSSLNSNINSGGYYYGKYNLDPLISYSPGPPNEYNNNQPYPEYYYTTDPAQWNKYYNKQPYPAYYYTTEPVQSNEYNNNHPYPAYYYTTEPVQSNEYNNNHPYPAYYYYTNNPVQPNEYNNNYGGRNNGFNPNGNIDNYGSSSDGSNSQYPNKNNYGSGVENGYHGVYQPGKYGPSNNGFQGINGFNGYNGYNGGGGYQNGYGGDRYARPHPMQYIYSTEHNRSAGTTALCAFFLIGFLYIVLILSAAFTCCAVCTCCGAKKNSSTIYPSSEEQITDVYPMYSSMNCGTASQGKDVFWQAHNNRHQPLNMGYDPMHTPQTQTLYVGETSQQSVTTHQHFDPQNVQQQQNFPQSQSVDPLPQVENPVELNCVQHELNTGYNTGVSYI